MVVEFFRYRLMTMPETSQQYLGDDVSGKLRSNKMPIQYKLDHVVEKLISSPNSEQHILHKLAGVKLSAVEASRVWQRVLDHKWYVSERLGRDVGLRVAAIDFFENIEPAPSATHARRRHQMLPPRLRMMQPLNMGN